ncbi:hypothetical protein FNJ84_07410 [Paracoccus sp. M683]|uniref:hypothetical protein n=1 Tax=Paracoccus sp. M683 TaxID=2594268 RepID=UPI00117DB693|nr:hypothetical protein [Paracoccus sp. M683]TRW97338.1 hypothetical protein FNJ84_07410 [Paracoccus sp. M683]
MRNGHLKAGAVLALSALAACEPTTGGGPTGGTVIDAGDAEMRITQGETIQGIAGGPLTLLVITRADGKQTTAKDEASARAAYAAYCGDKGGMGAEGEGYFTQFGGTPSWKFGNCGA